MRERVRYIDFFRGLAIINMIIYHTLYDLKYIFLVHMNFFNLESFYFYQQYICISFIFLSGVSSNYSSKLLKNGIKLFVISLIITCITIFFSKGMEIYFGVLHFLSIGMILIWLYHTYIKKNRIYSEKKHNLLFILTLMVFVLVKLSVDNMDFIYMFFYDIFSNIPFSFIIGFPKPEFYSSDYFPIIPWIFLMFSGYFFSRSIFHKKINAKFNEITFFNYLSFIEYIGKHSLIIYVLHQVIIYFALYLIFKIT